MQSRSLPAPAAPAFAIAAITKVPAVESSDTLPKCRYFWSTTVALYSAFTLKAAPQLSAAENAENFIICLIICAMAVIST